MGWRTPLISSSCGLQTGQLPTWLLLPAPHHQPGETQEGVQGGSQSTSVFSSQKLRMNVCPIGWESGDHRSSYSESNGQKKNYCCYILFVRDNKLLGQVTQPNLHQGKTIEQGQGCQSCGSLGAVSFGVLQRKWTSRMYERERMKEKEKLKCTLRDWPTQLWDLASLKYSR